MALVKEFEALTKIRLTDEEISGVTFLSNGVEGLHKLLSFDYIEAGAKAQLKKVVEWGNGYCQRGSHLEGNDMYPIPRRECKDCWQALVEEVK